MPRLPPWPLEALSLGFSTQVVSRATSSKAHFYGIFWRQRPGNERTRAGGWPKSKETGQSHGGDVPGIFQVSTRAC